MILKAILKNVGMTAGQSCGNAVIKNITEELFLTGLIITGRSWWKC